jgi:hypothetical protein
MKGNSSTDVLLSDKSDKSDQSTQKCLSLYNFKAVLLTQKLSTMSKRCRHVPPCNYTKLTLAQLHFTTSSYILQLQADTRTATFYNFKLTLAQLHFTTSSWHSHSYILHFTGYEADHRTWRKLRRKLVAGKFAWKIRGRKVKTWIVMRYNMALEDIAVHKMAVDSRSMDWMNGGEGWWYPITAPHSLATNCVLSWLAHIYIPLNWRWNSSDGTGSDFSLFRWMVSFSLASPPANELPFWI